jgi:hypothetical protein
MNRFSIICGFAIGLQLIAVVSAQTPNEQPKATEIPLDQIWGYNLPGTRDVAAIPLPEDSEQLGRERENNIDEIRRDLTAKRPSDRALPGFILPRLPDFHLLHVARGQLGMDSRRGAKGRTNTSFSTSDELTLVFFSHPSSYSLHLKGVDQQSNKITVRYQFEPHATRAATVHFAFIPLGKLSAGEYHVEFAEIPIERTKAGEVIDSIVCQSFSFKVVAPPTDEQSADETINYLIPPDNIYTYQMPTFRDVLSIDTPYTGVNLTDSPHVVGIFRALSRSFRTKPAGPAFIVKGRGKQALANAHSVLTGKAKGETELKLKEPATIIFYSLTAGSYVWLDHVTYSDHEVIINYRVVSHMTANSTNHFALIPLPLCRKGDVQVTIRQLSPRSLDGTLRRRFEEADNIVSQSFVFHLVE